MAHQGFTPPPLPPHGEPVLISEILTQAKNANISNLNEKTVRVVGRVKEYDPNSQVLLLMEPPSYSASKAGASSSKFPSPLSSNLLVVDMQLTDGEDCCLGSQVMIIGELEQWKDSRLSDLSDKMGENSPALILEIFDVEKNHSDKCGFVLKAVISKCIDTLDYTMYLRCIPVWRGEVT